MNKKTLLTFIVGILVGVLLVSIAYLAMILPSTVKVTSKEDVAESTKSIILNTEDYNFDLPKDWGWERASKNVDLLIYSPNNQPDGREDNIRVSHRSNEWFLDVPAYFQGEKVLCGLYNESAGNSQSTCETPEVKFYKSVPNAEIWATEEKVMNGKYNRTFIVSVSDSIVQFETDYSEQLSAKPIEDIINSFVYTGIGS